MNNILAIETTGRCSSVAVLKYDEEIREEFLCESSRDMNHLVDLVSLIDKVLEEAGIRIEDINIVAPSIGPGSFTGIRIGVTTARALSQALNIDCMPVRTLRGMAELDIIKLLHPIPHYICTSINARRGQTYAALWKTDEAGNIEEVLEQRQYMIDELLTEIMRKYNIDKRTVVFYGDGADSYKEQIDEKLCTSNIIFEIASEEDRYQRANSVARAAFYQVKNGEKLIKYEELLPDYMRKTEAEMKLEQGAISGKCKEVGK